MKRTIIFTFNKNIENFCSQRSVNVRMQVLLEAVTLIEKDTSYSHSDSPQVRASHGEQACGLISESRQIGATF